MEKILKFEKWIKRQKCQGPVAVLGAGPTMERYKRNYFAEKYDYVIGVNWNYIDYRVTCTVAIHYGIVERVFHKNDCPQLIYTQYCAETKGQDLNPQAPGVHFIPDLDLITGSSIVVTAAHLASLIGTEVHFYGVDLKLGPADKMYYQGYYQDNGRKPSAEGFNAWAPLVANQLEGLRRLVNKPFKFY